MFKSSVLKKVVASILALVMISTFSIGSCFALDGGYDDSNNQTESSTSDEESNEAVYEAFRVMLFIVFDPFDLEGSDEFVLDSTSRGNKYNEDTAKQMMSPGDYQDSDMDSNSDLDPDALI